jgi:uncharacterized delta-60 repeat protein
MSFNRGKFGPEALARFGGILLFLVAFSSLATAQSGPVDTSYNPAFKSFGSISNIIVQPDGKLLVNGGFRSVNGVERETLVRLNADGTTDTTFQPPAGLQAAKIALLSDGKILYRPYSSAFPLQGPQLARLNADGSADPTFSVSFENAYVYDFAVQPDGKILLAQQLSGLGDWMSRITRLNADGSVDSGFTGISLPNSTFVLSLLPKGSKIVVAGAEPGPQSGTPGRSAIRQFNGDGSPDSNFTVQQVGPDGSYATVSIQADGKILLSGTFQTVGNVARNQLARLNADGTVDTTFDTGAGIGEGAASLYPLPNGKIILGGTFTQFNGVTRRGLARLNADGSLDTGFDPGAGPNGNIWFVTPRPDGSLLIGGRFSLFNGTPRGGLALVGPNGALDSGVSATFSFSGTAQRLLVQPDGKVLVAGFFNNVNGLNQVNLTRLNTDGSSDTTFNSTVTILGFVASMRLQSNGKILLWGGFLSINGSTGTVINQLSRLNADGTLDTSFTPPAVEGFIQNALPQPDGKVIITGTFTSIGGTARSGIARLNADGSLDTTFTPNLQIGISSSFGSLRQIGLQSTGKILVDGFFPAEEGRFTYRLIRLNADGTTDTTFIPSINPSTFFNDNFFVQNDDRIVVAGGFPGQLARLLPDGAPDPDFTPAQLPGPFSFLQPAPGNGVLVGVTFFAPSTSDPSIFTPRLHLARFTSTGQRDTSLSPSLGITGNISDVAVQNDGKILLAGPVLSVANTPVSPDLSLVRLNSTISDACTFGVAPNSLSFNQVGGNKDLTITAGSDCVWTATNIPNWIFLAPDLNAGTRTIQVFAQLNTGPARTATITVAGQTITVTQAGPGSFTPGAYRPSNGFVYQRNANTTGFADNEFFYGSPNDIPVAGDWNGDGIDTIGVFRNGQFFLRNSNDTGFADLQFAFGAPGDIPVAGDWNGDGIDTIGVIRGNEVFLRNSNSVGDADIQFTFGAPGDLFIIGDWNGDGTDTIGAFRPSNGFVFLRNSNSTGFADIEFFYGLAGDRPIAGDWDNNGVDTIGVVRGNQWFLRNSNSTGFADIVFTFGTDSDIPLVGDWNGLP